VIRRKDLENWCIEEIKVSSTSSPCAGDERSRRLNRDHDYAVCDSASDGRVVFHYKATFVFCGAAGENFSKALDRFGVFVKSWSAKMVTA
jgi:hypothetical protein